MGESLGFILERLNWPIRLVRFRAARALARLLTDPKSRDRTLEAYLSWLGNRTSENEVCSGLAVLFATDRDARPALDTITPCLRATSILADFMLKETYGPLANAGDWTNRHSGEVPPSFEPARYFVKDQSAQVPPSMGEQLGNLERASGFPFANQWAFEWEAVRASSAAPLSGFPYHFLVSSVERSGVSAQIDQRQGDVMRSAYLRTLHCGVQLWGLPKHIAYDAAQRCLPVNRGLVQIEPIDRPTWLGELPDACAKDGAPLEHLVREILAAGSAVEGLVPVDIDIPLSREVGEFATLSISCALVSEDYIPLPANQAVRLRGAGWQLPVGSLFEGLAPQLDTKDPFQPVVRGKCMPLCAQVFPFPFGYWHGDLFHLGLNLPAAYAFDAPIAYKCKGGAILTEMGQIPVGRWRTWNDHWTLLYAKGGHTRCGGLSEMRASDIRAAADRLSLRVGWTADLKIWHRERSYDDLKLNYRTAHFLDDGQLFH